MERKFLENLKVGESPLGKEVIDAIMTEYERGVATAKGTMPFPKKQGLSRRMNG